MSELCIYRPRGKAGEYASWACNLYTGCSNDCEYCYCKKGPLGSIWTKEPRLKKCFKNEEHAYSVFIRELEQNQEALRREGLFFSFTTDPFLKETRKFTWNCILTALSEKITVSVLTKRADFLDDISTALRWIHKDGLVFGFTITGCNLKEPGASTNGQRIEAMERLHDAGFKTFASLEPIIDPARTLNYYKELASRSCCDLVKVGLESGRKAPYIKEELQSLHATITGGPIPYYFKKSYTDALNLPKQKSVNIQKL